LAGAVADLLGREERVEDAVANVVDPAAADTSVMSVPGMSAWRLCGGDCAHGALRIRTRYARHV